MTPKERFLTALKGGKPDHVPACPDMSNMIPCKLTGKPFWDIYLHKDPPLHEAYLTALRKYGFDGGWNCTTDLTWSKKDDKKERRNETLEKTDEKIVVRDYVRTPDGELYQDTVYWKDNPPMISSKYVKDVEKDFSIFLKYFFLDGTSACDDTNFQNWKEQIGDRGVASLRVFFPGLHNLVHIFDGKSEDMIFLYYDHPELFEEYREICHEHYIQVTKRALQAKPDILYIGSSGTLIFQTPDIFRKLGLPTLKEITRLAREAGVPCLMHSCGRERDLVKICAEETDLTGINPLEIPPMGDCNLNELKQKFGKRLVLMGNVHTTEVMLKGSPQDVERACKQAIDDGAEGGGFLLCTGDQCPRDTPEENIYRFIEVAKTYGKY